MSRPATSTRPAAARAGDDALQLIADALTDIAGWGVAALSVVRGDHTEMVAISGADPTLDDLLGVRKPVAYLEAEVAQGEVWGRFVHVPFTGEERTQDWEWVPDVEVVDAEDAWHPHDLLLALLRDATGAVRGTLSIDLPPGGRRPDAEHRRVLEKYAAQAERALVAALEREELAEQVQLAEAARSVVREALGQPSLHGVVELPQTALIRGFRAAHSWIQTFDEDGRGAGAVHTRDGISSRMPADLARVAEVAARRAWSRREVLELTEEVEHPSSETTKRIRDGLRLLGAGSALLVPLGVGSECVGNLVLVRAPGAPSWSAAEKASALEVGGDLAAAMLVVRTLEREQRLVRDLQALDGYKSELIATVSHELRNPLQSIVGHLEMVGDLETLAGAEAAVRRSLASMERGAARLSGLVEDLLLLSKVADPGVPLHAREVDLQVLVTEAVDILGPAAASAGVSVEVAAPDVPLLALGDAVELDRVVVNLLSNAVKYTPPGGSVRVSLARQGDQLVLTCADDGMGISVADQRSLFSEFFRSSNPEAVAKPGTGLGLAIVKRIVARHEGRIEVESDLGAGSTFRVLLPAA